MSGWLHRLIVVALAIAGMACNSSVTAMPSAAPAESRTPAPSIAGSAPRLPTPEQRQVIVQALASSGASVTRVTPSKFDWLFGNIAPTAAVFQGALDGREFWVDVHFLAGPVENLTACSDHGSFGETEFTIRVNGQPQVLGDGRVTGYLGSTGPMYFAASERHFVMTPHSHALDAVRRSLALSPPRC